jgi:hypothetical protein
LIWQLEAATSKRPSYKFSVKGLELKKIKSMHQTLRVIGESGIGRHQADDDCSWKLQIIFHGHICKSLRLLTREKADVFSKN